MEEENTGFAVWQTDILTPLNQNEEFTFKKSGVESKHHHKRRHRRTMSKAFDKKFIEGLANSPLNF